MIAQLRGTVVFVGDDHLILETGGVGYGVFASASVLQEARETSGTFLLWIETWVREEAITLYGFLNPQERDLFRLLLSVQGVGTRVALALLSAFSYETLLQNLAAQDKKMLTRADGVGAKLAERLVLELKDKVSRLLMRSPDLPVLASSEKQQASPGPLMQEAISALTHLGYALSESVPVVRETLQEPDMTLEALLKESLRRLGRKGAA